MSTKKTNHNIFCTINPKKAIVNTTVGQKNCKKKDNQKQKNTHYLDLQITFSASFGTLYAYTYIYQPTINEQKTQRIVNPKGIETIDISQLLNSRFFFYSASPFPETTVSEYGHFGDDDSCVCTEDEL